MRRPLPLLALVLVAALALAGCGASEEGAAPDAAAATEPAATATAPANAEAAGEDDEAEPEPAGPRAQVFMPAGEARATVILLHGWNDLDPAAYGAWIDHLNETGVAVVFPDYQAGLLSSPASMLRGTEAGIRDGLAEVAARGDTGPVVAAGYSLGGGLAVAYAALAADWGVEAPSAVYAVFPAEPLGLPAELPPVPDGTTVEMLVGDQDVVVGRSGADALAERIAPHPADIAVLASTDAVAYDHFAPKREDAQAQADFWAPLDRLVDEAAPPAG
jgi:acetyl esterase/lipase